jgi:anti-sigma regulatory factor (Ser/Thr protein kinase)
VGGDETRTRVLGQWDGAKDGWQGSLPLKPSEEVVVLDAQALRFAVPTFLLRLRAFVEWHQIRGHSVTVLAPTNDAVATYMARMGVANGLPDGIFIGLPDISSPGNSDVLIPITQLREFQEVDELGEQVFKLFLGHCDDDVSVFASAMHMAVSELCANAVEHGENPCGCYVAAQRYERPHRRTVLSLGDLGVGIPAHMRKQFAQLKGDRTALREALKEGVTATGKDERGIGFTSVIEEAMSSQMRYATLDIHSGTAQLQQIVTPDAEPVVTTSKAPNKFGTWLTFEIGPSPSV